MDPGKGVVCQQEDGTYQEKQWVCGVAGSMIDSVVPMRVNVHESLLETGDNDIAGEGLLAKRAKNSAAEAKGTKQWCQTQCQHFAFSAVKKYFAPNIDFVDNPNACAQAC